MCLINPFMPVVPKTAELFYWYLFNKSNFQKIYQGKILIKTQFTTLLQMFCEFMINFEDILKIT